MFKYKDFLNFEKKLKERIVISQFQEKLSYLINKASSTMMNPDSSIIQKKSIKGTSEYFSSQDIKISLENETIKYELVKNSDVEKGQLYREKNKYITEYIYVIDNKESKKEKCVYSKSNKMLASTTEYDVKSDNENYTNCHIIIDEIMLADEKWIKIQKNKYTDNYNESYEESKYYIRLDGEYIEIPQERYKAFTEKNITVDELFQIKQKKL